MVKFTVCTIMQCAVVMAVSLVLVMQSAFAHDDDHKRKPRFVPNGSTIIACVDKRGKLKRLVNHPSRCRKREIAVSWNVEGPQGPAGPRGPAGADGAPGTIAAGDCPDGQFVIGFDENGLVRCDGVETPPSTCPCRYTDLPATGLLTWTKGGAVQANNVVDGPNGVVTEDCSVLEAPPGDFEAIILTVTTEPSGVAIDTSCQIFVDGGIRRQVSSLTEEEVFACASDINSYALTLAASGVPITVESICPLAP